MKGMIFWGIQTVGLAVVNKWQLGVFKDMTFV
jgi:hypothetical protein